MSNALQTTLTHKYGHRQPEWVPLLLEAAAVLDTLEEREQQKIKVREFWARVMKGGYRGPIPREMEKRSDPNEEPISVILLKVETMLQHGTNTVRSIELKNVDYKDRVLDEEYGAGDLDYMRTLKHYPFLTRLTLENCAIPNVYRPGVLGNPGAEYQIDVLHRVLRRAPSLEFLKVVPEKETCSDGRAAQPGRGRRIDFMDLQTAIIPPPGFWAIDIRSLSLQTLVYVVPPGFDKYGYTQPGAQPLIPDVQHIPAPVQRLGLLKHLELECTSADDIARVRAVTVQMPRLSKLVVRSFGYPYPGTEQDSRAQIQVLTDLDIGPHADPVLEDLRLEFCYTPDDRLVSLVRKRKNGTGITPLKRLELRGCSKLFEETRAFLAKEVPHFVCEHEIPVFGSGEEQKKEELLRRLACL